MENNKKMSVSAIIAKFFKPFNAAAAAENIANREGISTDEVLKNWKKASEKGGEFSRLIRMGLEQPRIIEAITNGAILNADGFLASIVEHLKFLKKYGDLQFEQNVTYGNIRGRVDAIDSPTLFEFKFGKITFNNDYENMLKPFDKFDACKLHKHLFQLCIYLDMLDKINMYINRAYIIGATPPDSEKSTAFKIEIVKDDNGEWVCGDVDIDNISNSTYPFVIIAKVNNFLQFYQSLKFLENYQDLIKETAHEECR